MSSKRSIAVAKRNLDRRNDVLKPIGFKASYKDRFKNKSVGFKADFKRKLKNIQIETREYFRVITADSRIPVCVITGNNEKLGLFIVLKNAKYGSFLKHFKARRSVIFKNKKWELIPLTQDHNITMGQLFEEDAQNELTIYVTP